MIKVFTRKDLKLQDEKPASSLLISNSIAEYLIDAFDAVNEYAHTHNLGDVNSTENIRKYCNYIKTTSRCYKWALYPNNNTVQEMARNGNTINDIWNKMKIDHPDTLQYVPKNVINEMFPKLEKEYCSAYDTNILKSAVSNNRSIKSLLYNSRGGSKRVFEKNLQLLIELCDISNAKVLAMIDLFHPGVLIHALESVIAFQTVVMEAYYWCFIEKVDSTGLVKPLDIYKDRVNDQICHLIRILSLYSDENNIDESIHEESLKRYLRWLPTIKEIDSILINDDAICTHTATNGFIINTIQPEYGIPNLYIADGLSRISDLTGRFRRVWNQNVDVDAKKYFSLMDMYKGIAEETYQDYVHLKSMKYLVLQRFHENENLPNDQDAHMVWTEGVRNIKSEPNRNSTDHIHHDQYVKVSYYKPAVQRSFKKPLGTKTTYNQIHRNYSAMYRAHIIDKNILDDNPSIRFAQSISDLKPIGCIADKEILAKHVVEIADMEDSTNGFHESPFYSTDEYGDIDRSSWEPRRNNWNQ